MVQLVTALNPVAHPDRRLNSVLRRLTAGYSKNTEVLRRCTVQKNYKIPRSVKLVITLTVMFLILPLFLPFIYFFSMPFASYDQHTANNIFVFSRFWRDCVLVISLVLLISQHFFLRFGFSMIQPHGYSMAPTLTAGDMYLIDVLSIHLGRPINRGDIVVFRPPACLGGSRQLIKRVIGVPGDRIRVRKGIGVYVNDELLVEPYAKQPPMYALNTLGDIKGVGDTVNGTKVKVTPYADPAQCDQPIVVPPGQFFVLGDNRSKSFDSHNFGFISRTTITGKFWRYLWRSKSAPALGEKKTPAICYFCDATEFEVKKLIAGPAINICDACVATNSNMLKRADSSAPSASTIICAFCNNRVPYRESVGKEKYICLGCLSLSQDILAETERIEELTVAIKNDGNDTAALYERARIYLATAQYQLALNDLNRALEIMPDSAKMYTSRADVYRASKNLPECINDATRAIECDNGCTEAYRQRAHAHGDLDEFAKSVDDWSKVIELDPNAQDAYLSRSHDRIQIEQYPEAIADCDRVLEFDPNDAVAHNNRAKANLALKNYEKAFEDIQRAIELDDKKYAIFFYNRGLIYSALNKVELAVADFQTALKMNPKLDKAQQALADLTASQPTQ
jgi:signal peptidase I